MLVEEEETRCLGRHEDRLRAFYEECLVARDTRNSDVWILRQAKGGQVIRSSHQDDMESYIYKKYRVKIYLSTLY